MLVLLLNGFAIIILVHAAELFQKFDLGSVPVQSVLSCRPSVTSSPAASAKKRKVVWLTIWMVLVGSMIVDGKTLRQDMHDRTKQSGPY